MGEYFMLLNYLKVMILVSFFVFCGTNNITYSNEEVVEDNTFYGGREKTLLKLKKEERNLIYLKKKIEKCQSEKDDVLFAPGDIIIDYGFPSYDKCESLKEIFKEVQGNIKGLKIKLGKK